MKIFTKSILFIACLLLSAKMQAQGTILLVAEMNGSQVVPAVVTTATGVATLTLNPTRDTLCFRMTVSGLSGPITGAHIHAGDTSLTGPIVYDLTPFLNGTTVVTTISGSQLVPPLLSDYLLGNLYVDVHTAANPNGEIRGQILPESDIQFTAFLTGANETPPVTTNGIALGVFTLSKSLSSMTVHVVADSLSGPIVAAHLHIGAPGVPGPVAISLVPYISGNTINAVVNPDTVLPDLLAGNVYVNIHTALNPNGEIRGQLVTDTTHFALDAWLNGAQETPPVATAGMGVASFQLNTTFDTLSYDIVVTGLSGPPTVAHIHRGMPGVPGPILINLSAGINGDHISGTVSDSLLTPFIGALLSGNLYVNVHTAAHPNGEIRGQIYSVLREGFTAALSGMQVVPVVTTSALGTAAVSIGRDSTDLHYVIVTDSLSPTGINFHSGVTGSTGPSILDLTSNFANNGATGFWLSNDSIPFTTALASQFMNDSVYLDLFTPANPAGEIRGQFDTGYSCAGAPTAVMDYKQPVLFALYPNPVSRTLIVTMQSALAQPVTVKIYSSLGLNVMSLLLNPSKDSHEIDVSTLDPGLYFFEGRAGDYHMGQTFLKQ